jgi:hypothetical protein
MLERLGASALFCRSCRFHRRSFDVFMKVGAEKAARFPTDRCTRYPTYEEIPMRFMIMIKANQDSEAGKLPSTELLAAMGKYNEELAKAGVLIGAEGLHPSSKGARLHISGGKRTVVDGPFSEAKELIAGFWIFQTKSKEEAIEWVRRCPAPFDGDVEIEIRQIFDAPDFGENLTPELREAEARIGAEMAANAKR